MLFPPFVDIVKAGQLGRLKIITEKTMTRYWVAIHLPYGYDGSLESEAMVRDFGAFNEEMDASLLAA